MGIIKDAINRWYDQLNYLQQTVVQFFTSVFVLFAITGLGGLVFCGFESDQARPRCGAAGTSQHRGQALPRGFAARRATGSCVPAGQRLRSESSRDAYRAHAYAPSVCLFGGCDPSGTALARDALNRLSTGD